MLSCRMFVSCLLLTGVANYGDCLLHKPTLQILGRLALKLAVSALVSVHVPSALGLSTCLPGMHLA